MTWVSCQVSAALVCVQARIFLAFVKWLYKKQGLWRSQWCQKDCHDHNNDEDGYIIIIIIIIIMKLVISDTS